MRLIPTLTACALLLSATEALAAANSTRIAETGAYLLGMRIAAVWPTTGSCAPEKLSAT